MFISLSGNKVVGGSTDTPSNPTNNQIVLPDVSDYENYIGKFYNFSDSKFYTDYNPKTGVYKNIILPTSAEIIAELKNEKTEKDNKIIELENYKYDKIVFVQALIDDKKIEEKDIPKKQKEDFTFLTAEKPLILDGKISG